MMKKKWIFALALSASLFGGTSIMPMYAAPEVNLPEDVKAQVEKVSQLIQTNSTEADNAIGALLKKCKDKDLIINMGQYFLEKKQVRGAVACAERIYKLDAKYVPGLLFAGRVYLATGEKGVAGQKFEEAIYHDADCVDAYLEKSRLYKTINPTTAKETLLELKNKGVDHIEIEKELGSVFYRLNDVPNAIASYSAYFAKNQSADLESKKEFAILQYLNKDYAGSLATINEVISQAPKDLSLNRMKFYNLVEENKLEEAKAASGNLFGQYNDSLYNFNDYAQRGVLSVKMKEYAAAIPDFQKAMAMNPDKVDYSKDIADAYERMGDFEKAIAAYKIYVEKMGEDISLNDLRDFGKLYMSSAVDAQGKNLADKSKEYIALGDTIFGEVSTKSDSYVGPFYRARINMLLDLSDAVESAKNQYAETIKRLEGKGSDYDKVRAECFAYIMFYSFKRDDMATAKDYYQKVIALDPENSMAKQIAPALK